MRLEEAVEVLPDLRQPVGDLVEARVAHARPQLLLHELSPEVAAEEALDRLHVVGAEDPTEVVVQLEVGRRARGLVHRPDDVRAAQRMSKNFVQLSENRRDQPKMADLESDQVVQACIEDSKLLLMLMNTNVLSIPRLCGPKRTC